MKEIYEIIRHMMEKGHKQPVILDLLEYFSKNYEATSIKSKDMEDMSTEELDKYINSMKSPHRFMNT